MDKGKALGTDVFLRFALVVCVFGLLMLLVLYIFGSNHGVYPSFSKVLVGSFFVSLCLVGSAAALYPENCEGAFMFKSLRPPQDKDALGEMWKKIRFSGHHPDCRHFSSNRISIRGVSLCASCTGLLIGALVALAGTTLYFFIPIMPRVSSSAFLLVGYVCLLLGLFQYKFSGYVKLLANALFVFGAFLILMGIDAKMDLAIDLFGFGLIIFLLLTRISISQWNNKRICANCSSCLLRS